MKDGEQIVAAYSLDPRVVGGLSGDETHYPETFGFAATSDGYGLTFGVEAFAEPSTRAGRKYAKLPDGAKVVTAELVSGRETVLAVSKKRRALLCKLTEVKYLGSAGRGVMLMSLADDDEILAAKAAKDDRDTLVVKTSMGGEQRINTGRYELTSRGGKGREIMSRGALTEVVSEPVTAPEPLDRT
jgi:DNA gyrase subunit A